MKQCPFHFLFILCSAAMLTGCSAGLTDNTSTEAHGLQTQTAPDADGDGVTDKDDLCPNTPKAYLVNSTFKYAVLFDPKNRAAKKVVVDVDEHGCQLDSDKDGVVDHKDYCPHNSAMEISAGVNENGCPLQSDQDGTPDYRDHCPDTPRGVPTDRLGCPT